MTRSPSLVALLVLATGATAPLIAGAGPGVSDPAGGIPPMRLALADPALARAVAVAVSEAAVETVAEAAATATARASPTSALQSRLNATRSCSGLEMLAKIALASACGASTHCGQESAMQTDPPTRTALERRRIDPTACHVGEAKS